MRSTRALTTASSFAIVALVSVGLAGCANPIEQLVQQGVEQAAEEIIKQGSDGNIDVDLGGGASVPDDFPAGLPQPNGRLITAVKADKTWALTYEVADAAEADKLAAWFAADGWEELAVSDSEQLRGWSYQNDSYHMAVAALISDTVALTYTITTRE